jgi:hypothetical protein
MLMWFAPPIVRSDTSGAATTKALLEKYVVMMVLHGQLDKTTGVLSFDDIAALEAKDQNGRPLNRIASADLTPTTSALLAAMETMLRQSLGALGKGIRVFVFDAGAVKSCEKGKISVPFAGDTYTWQTPIPGCSR